MEILEIEIAESKERVRMPFSSQGMEESILCSSSRWSTHAGI